MNEVTRILTAIDQGEPQAAEALLPLVYKELRQLAARRVAREKPGQTLQATALVHEAYLRLVGPEQGRHWNSRGHFFGAAAEAMRRILVERARQKRRLRHGGGRHRVPLALADMPLADMPLADMPLDVSPLEDIELGDPSPTQDLVALDQAIERLSAEEPVVAQVVKLRYFAGLSIAQAAEALGISVRTANRHWAYAKAWLFDALGGDAESHGKAQAPRPKT